MGEDRRALIAARIREVLVSRLQVNPESVRNLDKNVPLLGQGIGLDSVEAMVLISELESSFDILFEDREITVDLFRTFDSLVNAAATKQPLLQAVRR